MITPKYIVKADFNDGRDKFHEYKVGDEYPRYGYKPDEKRIQELSTTDNVLRQVLIEKVEIEAEEEEPTKEKKSKKQWN